MNSHSALNRCWVTSNVSSAHKQKYTLYERHRYDGIFGPAFSRVSVAINLQQHPQRRAFSAASAVGFGTYHLIYGGGGVQVLLCL
jgi:hypothetical protein